MVVFTCGHCGESVQKPKVEKHYLTKCRNRNPNLSCMDCFKDFLGQDYEGHTKCVTEEQRYSGKGFVAKEKKGEKKQNAWVEMLQSVLDEHKNAPGNVRRIIETITKHNNTPRKKPKFINFVKNVCGQKTNPNDIDQAWNLISVKLSALSEQNKNKKKNGIVNGNADGKENKDTEEEKQNGDLENGENKNGTELESDKPEAEETPNGNLENGDIKKLSKKQRKEEKKRRKYEADLQSAGAPPSEAVDEEEETQIKKKDKKKKNKSESSINGDVEHEAEGKNKEKKRKRQDTNKSLDLNENTTEPEQLVQTEQVEVVKKDKNQKKKLKLEGEEEEENAVCLHDQNVARNEETTMKSDKFDWHTVIISLLMKKGNELPFKRLQKKVLSEYSEATGMDVDDRIADKFIKKLKGAPNVRVDKNRVYLMQ